MTSTQGDSINFGGTETLATAENLVYARFPLWFPLLAHALGLLSPPKVLMVERLLYQGTSTCQRLHVLAHWHAAFVVRLCMAI